MKDKKRCKKRSFLTAPSQHHQDTLLLPRETLNPAFNSFGICTCACLCERECIDGWGKSTDIPNPCKLSGLMESVQLQAEIFVGGRDGGPNVMHVCAWPSVFLCVFTWLIHNMEKQRSGSSDDHSKIKDDLQYSKHTQPSGCRQVLVKSNLYSNRRECFPD